MRWGELPGNSQDLLYWVLWFAIGAYSEDGLDELLHRILIRREGLAGDPGWEFEYEADISPGHYSFSADQHMSGISPECQVYNLEVVKEAIRKSLIARAEKYPASAKGVEALLRKFDL